MPRLGWQNEGTVSGILTALVNIDGVEVRYSKRIPSRIDVTLDKEYKVVFSVRDAGRTVSHSGTRICSPNKYTAAPGDVIWFCADMCRTFVFASRLRTAAMALGLKSVTLVEQPGSQGDGMFNLGFSAGEAKYTLWVRVDRENTPILLSSSYSILSTTVQVFVSVAPRPLEPRQFLCSVLTQIKESLYSAYEAMPGVTGQNPTEDTGRRA